eukprot:6197709-Pleurochrysis_carterae.AAC.1
MEAHCSPPRDLAKAASVLVQGCEQEHIPLNPSFVCPGQFMKLPTSHIQPGKFLGRGGVRAKLSIVPLAIGKWQQLASKRPGKASAFTESA